MPFKAIGGRNPGEGKMHNRLNAGIGDSAAGDLNGRPVKQSAKTGAETASRVSITSRESGAKLDIYSMRLPVCSVCILPDHTNALGKRLTGNQEIGPGNEALGINLDNVPDESLVAANRAAMDGLLRTAIHQSGCFRPNETADLLKPMRQQACQTILEQGVGDVSDEACVYAWLIDAIERYLSNEQDSEAIRQLLGHLTTEEYGKLKRAINEGSDGAECFPYSVEIIEGVIAARTTRLAGEFRRLSADFLGQWNLLDQRDLLWPPAQLNLLDLPAAQNSSGLIATIIEIKQALASLRRHSMLLEQDERPELSAWLIELRGPVNAAVSQVDLTTLAIPTLLEVNRFLQQLCLDNAMMQSAIAHQKRKQVSALEPVLCALHKADLPQALEKLKQLQGLGVALRREEAGRNLLSQLKDADFMGIFVAACRQLPDDALGRIAQTLGGDDAYKLDKIMWLEGGRLLAQLCPESNEAGRLLLTLRQDLLTLKNGWAKIMLKRHIPMPKQGHAQPPGKENLKAAVLNALHIDIPESQKPAVLGFPVSTCLQAEVESEINRIVLQARKDEYGHVMLSSISLPDGEQQPLGTHFVRQLGHVDLFYRGRGGMAYSKIDGHSLIGEDGDVDTGRASQAVALLKSVVFGHDPKFLSFVSRLATHDLPRAVMSAMSGKHNPIQMNGIPGKAVAGKETLCYALSADSNDCVNIQMFYSIRPERFFPGGSVAFIELNPGSSQLTYSCVLSVNAMHKVSVAGPVTLGHKLVAA